MWNGHKRRDNVNIYRQKEDGWVLLLYLLLSRINFVMEIKCQSFCQINRLILNRKNYEKTYLLVCTMFSMILPGLMSPRFDFRAALAFFALFRSAWKISRESEKEEQRRKNYGNLSTFLKSFAIKLYSSVVKPVKDGDRSGRVIDRAMAHQDPLCRMLILL